MQPRVFFSLIIHHHHIELTSWYGKGFLVSCVCLRWFFTWYKGKSPSSAFDFWKPTVPVDVSGWKLRFIPFWKNLVGEAHPQILTSRLFDQKYPHTLLPTLFSSWFLFWVHRIFTVQVPGGPVKDSKGLAVQSTGRPKKSYEEVHGKVQSGFLEDEKMAKLNM